jgi:hypothetical protein
MSNTEFLWLLIGLPVGTSSFVFMLLVWHGIWRSLGKPDTAPVLPLPAQA